MKKISVIIFILTILISACGSSISTTTTSVSETTYSDTTAASIDTATSIPTNTFIPTLTPTPKLPVLAGTPLPYNQSVISQENISHLTNIARWGTGKFIDAIYNENMKRIVVVTASSINYYDTEQALVIWSRERTVFQAKLSNNGEFLAVVNAAGIELWDANTGVFLRKLNGVSGNICPPNDECLRRRLQLGEIDIRQIEFSPDNKYLGVRIIEGTGSIFSGNSGRLLFWTLPSGDSIPTPSGEYFAFSPDSSLVAISVDKTTINIFKLETWERLFVLTLPDGGRYALPPDGLIFSPDSTLFIAGQPDISQLLVWNMTNGEAVTEITVSRHRHIIFISNSEVGIEDKSGNRIVDVYTEKQTKLPGEFRFSFGLYSAFDQLLSFSEGGEIIALGILNSEQNDSTISDRLKNIKEIHIWNTSQDEMLQNIPIEGQVVSCQFSDGWNSLSCLSTERFIEWNVITWETTNEITFGISLANNGIIFSQDATRLQAGNEVVETSSGETLFSSDDCCIGFSSNNAPVKLNETGNSVELSDAQTGETISVLETNPKGAKYHSSRNGLYLGVERNGIIQFWQLNDGKLLSSIGGGGERMVFGFSPDGTTIASGYPTNRTDLGVPITIQDISGKLVAKLEDILLWNAIAFSYDNKSVAISGYSKISIYNITDRNLVATIDNSLPCESMAFSINSDLLFCGLSTGILQIFSIPTTRLVSQISAHSNMITSLSLNSNGTLLGSGSSDGTTKLWAIWP